MPYNPSQFATDPYKFQSISPLIDSTAPVALPTLATDYSGAQTTPTMMQAFSSWLKDNGVIGTTDKNGIKTDGWGGLALGAAQGLGSMYLGMQQYGLAKDTLAQNKKQFDLNYAAQKQNMNTQLEDRQAARVASNPNAYQSVGDYMKQHGI